MKKYIYSFIAIVSLCAISCSKELPAEKNNGNDNPVVDAQCVINASVSDMTKLTLSGLNFSWDAGDKLLVRLANTNDGIFGDVYGSEKFTASSSGSSTVFTGSFQYYDISGSTAPENTYCYFATDGRWASAKSPFYYKTVPTSQTGLLSDIKDNILLYGAAATANISLVKDSNEVPVGYSFDLHLHPFFSVLKVNVPASLNLTELVVKSESAIAGTYGIKPMGRTYGTWVPGNPDSKNDGFLDRGSGITSNEYEITVSRGGAVISGDVYIVVIPDAFDSDKKEYYCNTDKLTFVLTDANGGSTTFTNYLNGKIYCKSLKDLGTMPSSFTPSIEAGALCLLDDTSLKVGVANASASCTYYYETAASKSALAIPTTSSIQFDPAEGFAISSASSYDAVYVNVLAKSNDAAYSSKYLTGVVRNWNFKSGTPVAEALALADANSVLTTYGSENVNNGATYTTSDGITLYRQRAGSLSLTTTDEYIKHASCYVWPIVTVDKSADVWYYVKTANDIRYGANIVYNRWGNTATTDVDGNTCSIAVAASSTVQELAFTFHLGDLSSGDRLGFRGDASKGNRIYNIALLEIGEDVGIKTNAAPSAVRLISSNRNAAIALDEEAVADAVAVGARYY